MLKRSSCDIDSENLACFVLASYPGSLAEQGRKGEPGTHSMCIYKISLEFVTGSGKRYTNAHTMIFLYKRSCSKTHNIFYSLKKKILGA